MPTHIHIVPDYVTLFRLVTHDEEQNNDLQQIIDLIQDGRLILETSPITAHSAIRAIELNCSKSSQKAVIDQLLDIIRVNSENAIDYEQIIREAIKLKPYGNDLIFEDIFNLVFANQIGKGIMYLTSKKLEIENFIIAKSKHHEYSDVEIHDLASLFDYFDHQDFWNSSDNIIFVKTPQGDLIRLPIGATAVDFAYTIHTNIGHKCMKAFANSEEIPLNKPLEDGQTIQIITNPDGEHPDLNWLSFVVSNKAKEQINQWLKHQNIERGKNLILLEYGSQYVLNGDVYSDVARRLNCKNTSHLFEKLGSGEISIDVINKAVKKYRQRSGLGRWITQGDTEQRCLLPIKGVHENEQVILSLCCHPLPKDGDIIGILDQRKNLRIHSASCNKISSIDSSKTRKLTWNCDSCTAEIQVTMTDRPNILRMILDKTAGIPIKTNVRKVSTNENPAFLEFYALASNKAELDILIEEIKSIPKDVHQVKIKSLSPSSAKFDGSQSQTNWCQFNV